MPVVPVGAVDDKVGGGETMREMLGRYHLSPGGGLEEVE